MLRAELDLWTAVHDHVQAGLVGQFRRLEGIGAMAHGADDETPLHAVLRLATPETIEYCADDRVITGIIGAPYLIWLLATVNREGRGG
mgnify:CR=1 FL=1